ncbi:hypothetical protein K458DRAFT_296744 [Lentithecium fluviatile CBS 122367]|uniref:Oxidoreductase-like domain-containing protein n=1 Tax=Lentithecium fluviatile CBS 122367 TaxID=1168545 RepID=A0A6G1J9X4_9PLEO|nr:hypothetical protein K458DRAFT_296744 [Lentithecium fluviatile CBS 122367]
MEQLAHSARPLAVRQSLCASCLRTRGISLRRIPRQRIGLQNSDRIQRRSRGYIARPGEQARPLDGFYNELLSKPLPQTQSATRTAPEPPPPESPPKTTQEETLAKARIVFGSKLAGPAERKKEIEGASQMIAGVMVPPRPDEPGNCCMSGCVNCVWDLYRDEMEEWAAKSAEARARIQARREDGQGSRSMLAEQGTPSHAATSLDDDGGGSETNWGSATTEGHLFDDIPVGIREFMKTEKRLKQKHAAAA